MNRTRQLHDLGQSLWLDDITDDGTLRRYIDEFSITGLTSNPTIFEQAIGSTAAYDDGIRDKERGAAGEALFLELALEDLRRAADLFRGGFRPYRRRRWLGIDGGVAPAGERHVRQHRGGGAESGCGRSAKPLRQDSRHARRRSRSRSSTACHPALARTCEAYLRGIERRIAARGFPRSRPCSSAAGTRRLSMPRRTCALGSRSPRTVRVQCCVAALARPRRRRRTPAAPALGQYRDQGPTGVGHPVRRSPGSARHHQHNARQDVCAPSPNTGTSAARRPSEATPRGCWRVSPTRGSTSKDSRCSCNSTASGRS